MADKFALRTRVAVPDSKGKIQGVVVWRIDAVDSPSTCGVSFLNDKGKLVTRPFDVRELAAGATFSNQPSKAREQLRARRKR